MSMTKAELSVCVERFLTFKKKLSGNIEQDIAMYDKEIEQAQLGDKEGSAAYIDLLNLHKSALKETYQKGRHKFNAHHFENMKITERLKVIQAALNNSNSSMPNSADADIEKLYRAQLEQAKNNILMAKEEVGELKITSLQDIAEALAKVPPVSKDFPLEVQQCYQELLQEKRLSFEAARQRFESQGFGKISNINMRFARVQDAILAERKIQKNIKPEQREEINAYWRLLGKEQFLLAGKLQKEILFQYGQPMGVQRPLIFSSSDVRHMSLSSSLSAARPEVF